MEKQHLYTVIESLPPSLQSKVYDYAVSLQGGHVTPATPLILNMHKDALVVADDFDEPLPDSFWLGNDVDVSE